MKEQKNEENLAEEELQLNRPLNSEKTTEASIITPNFYVFPNPLLGKFKNRHNPNTWISHLVYVKAKIEGGSPIGQD